MMPQLSRETLQTRFDTAVRAPIRAFRWAYLPPLMVYFAAGAIGITAVANDFWVKTTLSLSPLDLAALGVWLGLPSIMKMVFGEMVDTIRIFGSQRRVYICAGAAMTALALLILAGTAAGRITVLQPNTLYIIAALLSTIGLVLQDVAADAMTTEVVPRHAPDGTERLKADIDADLAMVQVLGRIFLISGGLLVAYLGGYLASIWSYATVFLVGLIVPAISVVGAFLVAEAPTEQRPTDWRILGGGLAFGAIVLALGLLDVPFAQEITLVVSLTVIGWMLSQIATQVPEATRWRIFYAALIIFFFRAYPSTGDGYRWFLIDTYGFDERFFGSLATIGALLTLITAWFMADLITRMRITSVLLWLTIVSTVLALPGIILVFDGAMSATTALTGLGPRSLAIFDTAVQSPIINLGMIPMLTLIAINAPAGSRAVWFSLMASFMNAALTAGDLMTKYMNMLFVIDRGKYEALPALTVWVTVIAFVLPVAAIIAWRKRVD
jgi:MFS family permease